MSVGDRSETVSVTTLLAVKFILLPFLIELLALLVLVMCFMLAH